MKKKERSGSRRTGTSLRITPNRMQQRRHEKPRHQIPMTYDQQTPPLQPDRFPLPCLQPILTDSTCIFDCVTCQNLSSSTSQHIPFSVFPLAISLSIKPDNAGAPFWLPSSSAARPKRCN